MWEQIGELVVGIIGKTDQNIFEIGNGLHAVCVCMVVASKV